MLLLDLLLLLVLLLGLYVFNHLPTRGHEVKTISNGPAFFFTFTEQFTGKNLRARARAGERMRCETDSLQACGLFLFTHLFTRAQPGVTSPLSLGE